MGESLEEDMGEEHPLAKFNIHTQDDLDIALDDPEIVAELTEYFADEMPYGYQKARTGTPEEWLWDHLHADLEESCGDAVEEKLVKDGPGEGHFDGEVDCTTEFDDSCYDEVEEDVAGIDPEIEAAILDLAMALGLEDADQDDAEVIGKKLDVPASDVHKVINQDLTQESKK
jgi:hypothetical protein